MTLGGGEAGGPGALPLARRSMRIQCPMPNDPRPGSGTSKLNRLGWALSSSTVTVMRRPTRSDSRRWKSPKPPLAPGTRAAATTWLGHLVSVAFPGEWQTPPFAPQGAGGRAGFEAGDLRRRDGEAHILRVGLAPGHHPHHFSALVEDRPSAVSRGDRAGNLIITHLIHTPNLADEPLADAEIEAPWGAHHVDARANARSPRTQSDSGTGFRSPV